jgi:hypothetical protein
MKNIMESTSAFNNWRQGQGFVRDKATNVTDTRMAARQKLRWILYKSVNEGNFRDLAARAEMNSLDLIETITTKLGTLGVGGLKGAVNAYKAHGIVTCLQYLNSL